MTTASTTLEDRVRHAAEGALSDQRYVGAIDVLGGLRWLTQSHVDRWRQGRLDDLESAMGVKPSKRDAAMTVLRKWAEGRGLVPVEIVYVARTRDGPNLRFSSAGDAEEERAYRTHWLSPELSTAERERLIERLGRAPELVVVQPLKDWSCAGCEGTGDLLLMDEPGPLCMRCAEMADLVFLPAGDAGLTRRAKAASRRSAVVVRWSRTRRRYERKGILVEPKALAKAER